MTLWDFTLRLPVFVATFFFSLFSFSLTLSVFSFSEFHPDREITENLFTVTVNILRTLVHPLGLRRNVRELYRFTYLIMKKKKLCTLCTCSFHFWHFADVFILSATWNDLFCSWRWFQFNSRIVRTHFASVMTLNNWEMIAETRSYIFRWRSRCCWRRVCVNSLVIAGTKRAILSEQYHSILPARVANHSAEFGSPCPLTELVI